MLIFSTTIVIWPLIYTFYLSLLKWIITLGAKPKWVGVDNYLKVLTDKWFWNALKNTIVFVLGTVPAGLAMGLLLALILNMNIPGKGVFRTIYFIPTVASTIVMALTWKFMFSDSMGIIPYFLEQFGLAMTDWMTSAKLALPGVIISSLWQNVGFIMVIYLAALQGVPPELYEAAKIDGAKNRQATIYITIPLLAPATLFASVISVIQGFKVFDQVYVMTGGGPGYSTTTLVQLIYEKGFQFYDLGSATSISVLLFLIMLIFTVLQIKLQRER